VFDRVDQGLGCLPVVSRQPGVIDLTQAHLQLLEEARPSPHPRRSMEDSWQDLAWIDRTRQRRNEPASRTPAQVLPRRRGQRL
jgi:hypothetical protein